MTNTRVLYQTASDEDIPIFGMHLPENGSICLQTEAQRCYIGMDYGALEDEADCRVHLAHELGHCVTGSFYNRWAARDVRRKHENHANKWAVRRLITPEELDEAVAEGYDELWSLAEYFNVTEDFMRIALCWHIHGNLDVEDYMTF